MNKFMMRELFHGGFSIGMLFTY